MVAPACTWEGHAAAMDEAGFCPVCQGGDIDPEWADRNAVDLSEDDDDPLEDVRGYTRADLLFGGNW